MTRIFFSVGDSSGDIHGANLVRALRRIEASIECEGLGGYHMAQAGMDMYDDLADRGIMGFTEVLKSFAFVRRLFHDTVERLKKARPDALVLIDYPGFNIRLAQRAHDLGIPVVYYISPQVWAWKKRRVHTMAKCVDKMLVIFPFEKALYDAVGLDCEYVGHPLLDHIDATPIGDTFTEGVVIGLLPGSREQEISRILPVMLEVARGIRKQYPDARFVAPCVGPKRAAQIEGLAGDFPLETAIGKTYELLHGARFCMVASGTATLETALFQVPMVVMYKVTGLTYWLARRLVHIDTIALVNILAERTVVPEFVQNDADPDVILPKALELIEDSAARRSMLGELASIREKLGEGGASDRAAEHILHVSREHSHG